MHAYRVTKDTNIRDLVYTAFYPLVGPPSVPATYQVSKELVAYLETLVAFTPYYRADDARMSGKMELFYQQALLRYKDYPYDEFHQYITRKMTAFYKKYGAAEAEQKQDSSSGDEGEVVQVGALPEGAIVSTKRAYNMSDEESEEGGKGGKGGEGGEGGEGMAAAAAAAGPAAAGADGDQAPAAAAAAEAAA